MMKLFFTVMLCGLLIFSAGAAAEETEYWITIDPIPDQVLGSTYMISGETNLPEGSRLLFEHDLIGWCAKNLVCNPPPDSGMFSKILEVRNSTGDTNIWHTSVDTSRVGRANNFAAKVYSLDTSAWNMTTYNLTEPTSGPPRIIINVIPDQNTGTPVTITGSVFMSRTGSFILWIYPVWFDHNATPDTSEPLPFVKYVQVSTPERTTEPYRWNVSIDSSGLPSDMYLVEATGIDYDTKSQNRTFLLRDITKKENYAIEILSVKNAVAGETVAIRGSISTGDPKTLLYELTPKGTFFNADYIREGYTRTIPLHPYGKKRGSTAWEISLNTTGLVPGNYLLKISAPDTQSTADTEITLMNTTEPQQTPAAKIPGFGFGILVSAFTTAVVFGALRKK